MIQTNLILIDGLSGSGKSYTAQYLALNLQRNGHQAKWVYEHEVAHPIYPCEDLFRLPAHEVHQNALPNWRRLVASLTGTEQICLMESAFFQTALNVMSRSGLDKEAMRTHILHVQEMIAPLSPLFIYYHQDDVAQALRKNCDRRGPEFEELLFQIIPDPPSGGKTFDDVVAFFQTCKELTDALFAELTLKKLAMENSQGEWDAYNQQIAEFLAIPPLTEHCTPLNPLSDLVGTYRQNDSDETLVIVAKENRLFLDHPTQLRLLHKAGNHFCVEGTLNEISFAGDGTGSITRLTYQEPEPNPCVLEFVKCEQ